ncbi:MULTISPECIES: hypothetical protein [Brucella]|nr:hypothetical protein [Brucella intermedia]
MVRRSSPAQRPRHIVLLLASLCVGVTIGGAYAAFLYWAVTR